MSLQQAVEVGAVVACESRCVRHIAVRFAQDADERAALEQCHALGEGHRFTIWKSVGCVRSACRRETWRAGTPAPVRVRVQPFEPILRTSLANSFFGPVSEPPHVSLCR
jgi:hypothetical protein